VAFRAKPVSHFGRSWYKIPGRIEVMTVEDDALAKADVQEVYRLMAEGRPVTDPGLIKRVRERSEAARRAVFERNGLLDVAVPLIRALRRGEDA
jgi:hypothetical protein